METIVHLQLIEENWASTVVRVLVLEVDLDLGDGGERPGCGQWVWLVRDGCKDEE